MIPVEKDRIKINKNSKLGIFRESLKEIVNEKMKKTIKQRANTIEETDNFEISRKPLSSLNLNPKLTISQKTIE